MDETNSARAPLAGSPSLDASLETAGPPVFELDGRKFRSISQSLTAAQDDYLLGHLRRSGALEVLANTALSNEDRAKELLTQVMLSGETFHVLAGCLTEEGKAWSRREADRNAGVFAAITDGAQKLAMRGAIVGFVLGFFASGARSSETSPRSSSPSEKDRATMSADPQTSETSPLSFAKLQEATAIGSAR